MNKLRLTGHNSMDIVAKELLDSGYKVWIEFKKYDSILDVPVNGDNENLLCYEEVKK